MFRQKLVHPLSWVSLFMLEWFIGTVKLKTMKMIGYKTFVQYWLCSSWNKWQQESLHFYSQCLSEDIRRAFSICLVKRCHFHFWNKIFLTLEDKSLERFWTIVLLISTTIAGVLCAQCEGHAAPPLLLWSCPTGNQEINGTEVAQWIWMWCGMKLVSAASVLLIAPGSDQSWNFTASTKEESRWDYEVSCIYTLVVSLFQSQPAHF